MECHYYKGNSCYTATHYGDATRKLESKARCYSERTAWLDSA